MEHTLPSTPLPPAPILYTAGLHRRFVGSKSSRKRRNAQGTDVVFVEIELRATTMVKAQSTHPHSWPSTAPSLTPCRAAHAAGLSQSAGARKRFRKMPSTHIIDHIVTQKELRRAKT